MTKQKKEEYLEGEESVTLSQYNEVSCQNETPTLISSKPKKERAFYRNAELNREFTVESCAGTFKKIGDTQSIDQSGNLITFSKQEIITYV